MRNILIKNIIERLSALDIESKDKTLSNERLIEIKHTQQVLRNELQEIMNEVCPVIVGVK